MLLDAVVIACIAFGVSLVSAAIPQFARIDVEIETHRVRSRVFTVIIGRVLRWLLSAWVVAIFCALFLSGRGHLPWPLIDALPTALLLTIIGAGAAAATVVRRSSANSVLVGEAVLARKVYVGDSVTLSLMLRSSQLPKLEGKTVTTHDTVSGKVVGIDLKQGLASGDQIEAELVAPALVVGGAQVQTQGVSSAMSFKWVGLFEKSGVHEYFIVLRHVRSLDKVELGSIDGVVRVVQVWKLTTRQIWILGAVFAGVPTLWGLIQKLMDWLW